MAVGRSPRSSARNTRSRNPVNRRPSRLLHQEDQRTNGGDDTWTQSLKWQRITPYEKFAAMLDRHWESIAAYCHPENKVSLGLVEGLNNKIRVLQRRAYSFRDEDYLKNSKSSVKD